nr:hypothetical protein [Tanacetum cinerariifolium]
EEELDDEMLVAARDRVADPVGSLKLYVRASNSGLEPLPTSASRGLPAKQSPFTGAPFSGKAPDEETLQRLQGNGSDLPTDLSTIRQG